MLYPKEEEVGEWIRTDLRTESLGITTRTNTCFAKGSTCEYFAVFRMITLFTTQCLLGAEHGFADVFNGTVTVLAICRVCMAVLLGVAVVTATH